MRITQDLLFRFAEDAVNKRVTAHRSTLLAAYLHGSVNGTEFAPLGGTTDIDMVFVWEIEPPEPREIIRLTDEIHLDIIHHNRSVYRSPRELRTDPWMGPTIYNFKILHDPQHILDFAQASVRDRFFEPNNVITRSRKLAGRARDAWMSFLGGTAPTPETAIRFLGTVADAANAVVLLNGAPLAERSFLTDFYRHTQSIGKPSIYLKLLEILGGGDISTEDLRGWLPAWLDAISTSTAVTPDTENSTPRISYYKNGVEALLASERPPDALWPLLWTWGQTVNDLEPGSPGLHNWKDAFKKAGIIGEKFEQRLAAMDACLDEVEETLEEWGRQHGTD